MRHDINERAATIHANTAITPAEQQQRLAALAEEATTRLTTSLGSRGYAEYTDLKGDWIRALTKSAAKR